MQNIKKKGKIDHTNLLLNDIAQVATFSIDKAISLPPGAYTSNSFLDLEIKNLFQSDWVCVGRTIDLNKTGDYLTSDIAGQAIFTIKGKDGNMRSYSNVCLHRMMCLLDGHGNCENRIVCPYHAWSYETDGRLAGAPQMEARSGFDADKFHLPEVLTEIWQGWIYVTLNDDAVSISGQLAPLEEIVGRYNMAAYVQIEQTDTVWNTNWKCLIWNSIDIWHAEFVTNLISLFVF